jgi:hypothetical protein
MEGVGPTIIYDDLGARKLTEQELGAIGNSTAQICFPLHEFHVDSATGTLAKNAILLYDPEAPYEGFGKITPDMGGVIALYEVKNLDIVSLDFAQKIEKFKSLVLECGSGPNYDMLNQCVDRTDQNWKPYFGKGSRISLLRSNSDVVLGDKFYLCAFVPRLPYVTCSLKTAHRLCMQMFDEIESVTLHKVLEQSNLKSAFHAINLNVGAIVAQVCKNVGLDVEMRSGNPVTCLTNYVNTITEKVSFGEKQMVALYSNCGSSERVGHGGVLISSGPSNIHHWIHPNMVGSMPLLFLKDPTPVVRNFFPHFNGKTISHQQNGRINLAASNYRSQRTYDAEEARNYAEESRGESKMGDLMPIAVFYSTFEER